MLSSTMNEETLLEGELQTLDVSHIHECAKVMAQAFSDSPAYNYIFQNETQEYREKALEWLFQKNLELMIQKCPTVLRGYKSRTENGDILCCFLWVPSESAKLGMWEMIIAGMWQIPFRFGVATLKRLLSLMDSMEATIGQASSKSPDYIMLQRMVVRPDCQGRGIGSKALQAILQESHNGKNIHLETQEERNVLFYQRLGWQISQEQDYCQEDTSFQFHSWHMVRTTEMK